jgi:thioredoxin 1
MMAFSRIVTCHTEEEYAKVFKKAGEKDMVLVEFVAGWSTSSKNMAPYLNTLAKSPEYKKVHFVRVDMETLGSVAQKANVKALPTYQLYRNGEKLEEMSGAMPAKLVAMLKTHHVKDKKSGPGKLVGLIAGILLGILGLLKLKDQIEEWEAEEEERAAIAEAEEEARRIAEEEAKERARKTRMRAQAASKAKA